MTAHEKYRVVRKIDTGGMAEIFLGQAESIEGFRKQVAIKRVLPHLAENQKFLAMFLDEARLSLRFNHANVVQTFDIGRSGNTYFVVMEYVDGANLKQVMEILRENGQILPVELAVFILLEICHGLAYAHTAKDRNGRLLGIVHRDVSPPNVLLSKRGEVKIVDFGLAKATSQLERTDPGVVKGKFAYLSPEAAWGREVDHRADIFACGIILWELLSGKRLFLGANDIETIKLIRAGEVPSLQRANPLVPQSLEAIVRKTLAREPDLRFQSCDAMAEALADFLFEHGRKVTSFDVGRLIRRISEEDSGQVPAKPSIIDQLIQEELGRFASLGAADSKTPPGIWEQNRDGAAPLDPTGFEDPRRWVGELGTFEFDTPIPDQEGSGVWRESGYRESSPPGISVPRVSQFIPSQSPEPPSLEQMLEGETRAVPASPSDDTGRKVILFAIAAIATVAVGGALAALILGWFF